jgi:Cys-tRNA(Pro)/Cys-tRNA(Cys) deacylase
MKTNAMRLLDNHKISYDLLAYTIKKDAFDAVQIAINQGIPVHLLFKTLVCVDDCKQIIVAVLPANAQLSIKKLEQISNVKNIALLAAEELPGKTGYMRGGCTPLAMKKKFPVFLHTSAKAEEHIWVNAGKKGFLLKIDPNELLRLTEGTLADIAR